MATPKLNGWLVSPDREPSFIQSRYGLPTQEQAKESALINARLGVKRAITNLNTCMNDLQVNKSRVSVIEALVPDPEAKADPIPRPPVYDDEFYEDGECNCASCINSRRRQAAVRHLPTEAMPDTPAPESPAPEGGYSSEDAARIDAAMGRGMAYFPIPASRRVDPFRPLTQDDADMLATSLGMEAEPASQQDAVISESIENETT